jgi:hypothetical protein
MPDTKQAEVSLYVQASAVLNELPVTAVDMLTVMAKRKFSDQILAGHDSDKHVSQFRTEYIVDAISAAHKQFLKQVKVKDEQRCRDLYTQLRARGISVVDASKASGYNPLV